MFHSRVHAGQLLAARLQEQKLAVNLIVAIPRGGVVVAAEIARILKRPLKLLFAKKIAAPQNQELAIGAVVEDGTMYLDEELKSSFGITTDYLQSTQRELLKSLQKRRATLTGKKELPDCTGKTVLLVDDGIATGATVIASFFWLKKMHAKRMILAAPVVSGSIVQKLEMLADQCVFLITTENFQSVGQFYQSFPQVSDGEVRKLL
jgi:predicted phosphoribosyltransferase